MTINLEALQDKYSAYMVEAGKRNSITDSKRVRGILALCLELLSSEIEDEKKIEEAMEKLALLHGELLLTEAVDKDKFPASAYAYTPDTASPATWRLRLTSKAELKEAAAYLSEGGLRGVKLDLPEEELPYIKRMIRRGFIRKGITADGIPASVRESLTPHPLTDFVPLTEAVLEKGRAVVTVISPGFNYGKTRYYPKEVLIRDYKVFEGVKMYADHPTAEERKAMPERSIKSDGWVAVLKDVTVDESTGVITGVAEIVESWLMEKLSLLKGKKLLSEMGISINAVGNAFEDTIENTKTLVIESITQARSVDFVTEPGAHGRVTFYEAFQPFDVDLVSLDTLKERRPDIVEAILKETTEQINKEVKLKMTLEEQVTQLTAENKALTEKVTAMTEAADATATAAAKAEKVAAVQVEVAKVLDAAELPKVAKEKITAAFSACESTDGLEAAITAEKAYVLSLQESAEVKGLGPKKTDDADGKKALYESMKAAYPDSTEAELQQMVNV